MINLEVDIDVRALRAASDELGTPTIDQTVNAALRRIAAFREQRDKLSALDGNGNGQAFSRDKGDLTRPV